MNEQLIQIVILLFCQIAGSVAIGSAIRSALHRQIGCNSIFMIVWGLMFGGVSLSIGLQLFVNNLWLVAAQVIIFFGVIGAVALMPDVLRDALKSASVSRLIMGSLFGVVGISILISAVVDQTQVAGKLLSGSIFTLAGGGIFWRALSTLGQE